jgi:hypothetical protein
MIESMPKSDSGHRLQMKVDIENLTAKKVKMLAKAASLVADDKGVVLLTKTQLRELFEL